MALLWGLAAGLNVAGLALPFEDDELVWEVQWDCAADLWEEIVEFVVRDQDWGAISFHSLIDGLVFSAPALMFWIGLALCVAGWPSRGTALFAVFLNASGFTLALLLAYPVFNDSGLGEFWQALRSEVRIGFYVWWASLWAAVVAAILVDHPRAADTHGGDDVA